MHRCHASPGDIGAEVEATLAYIYEESTKGNKVRSTDLVKKLRFGTLPTVTGHIQKLIETGLIQQVVAEDDRRVRWCLA